MVSIVINLNLFLLHVRFIIIYINFLLTFSIRFIITFKGKLYKTPFHNLIHLQNPLQRKPLQAIKNLQLKEKDTVPLLKKNL